MEIPEEKIEYIYDRYIEWKARPIKTQEEDASYPKTAKEFADIYGIPKEMLADFSNRQGFWDKVARESVMWAKSRIPEIIHAVFNDSKKLKTPEAAERFLSVINELNKAMKPDTSMGGGSINNFNFFGDIDDEKYKRIIEREAKRCALTEGGEEEAD